MQVPVVLVGLLVEDLPQSSSSLPQTRHVDFELSKEALATIIDIT